VSSSEFYVTKHLLVTGISLSCPKLSQFILLIYGNRFNLVWQRIVLHIYSVAKQAVLTSNEQDC